MRSLRRGRVSTLYRRESINTSLLASKRHTHPRTTTYPPILVFLNVHTDIFDMAPVQSKLLSTAHSPYVFSATMVAFGNRPNVIKCVAPSPPRRVRSAQLTITRVFKTQSTSMKRVKLLSNTRDTSAPPQTQESAVSPVHATPSQRAATPVASGSAADDLLGSPLSSLSSSPPPPSSISRVRGRTPDDHHESRNSSVPHAKPSSGARLTRSSSRSSLKSTNKPGRRGSMRAIDARLKPDGGIVTRYGEQDGEPIFIRQERVTSTTEPDVLTYFWESFTTVPLRHPPDLSSYPELTVGDVYCNILRGETRGVQLWIWVIGDDGVGHWKRAREGDMRDDGRRLTITPKRQQPSWVSPTWGVKQLKNQMGR
ncbi:hypothetical protein L226DRAFT_610364 [Lentinus tigrinus ALCF2SS1-7]|uniref:uncharacterized protein n=1 Tax=Lentinus tigrinus ALCF2SS1-7 TaxID=1328758 RepID=UPI0011661D7F|nr:hypothetical protein L226DRAFT_610364 [Lentinus tigrinus ALCF2SS1-7]